MRLIPILAVSSLLASPLAAQQPTLNAALSTRATAVVSLTPPRVQGQPAAAPRLISVDYGQPHARGREVPTEFAAEGTIWRTGANSATTLTTAVDLTIGGAAVPAGAYSLYTIREKGQYLLIINKNTGQWGTEYDGTKDLARVPMRMKATTDVTESLSIALVPAEGTPARGALTIAWGKLHLSADWSVR